MAASLRRVVFVGGIVLAFGAALGLGGAGVPGGIGAPVAGASSTTLYVTVSGTGTSPSAGCATGYPTIQTAVTHAAITNTIQVCPGTYHEQVQVPKTKTGLTIVGTSSNPSAVVVEPTLDNTPTPFEFSVTDFPFGFPTFPVVPIIYVASGVKAVTLSDLEVDTHTSEGRIGVFGIYYDTSSSGVITDVIYTGDPTTAASGGSQNTGIFADHGTKVSITNSHVSEFYKSGIICAGHCDITGNVVTGVGPTPTSTSPLSSGQNGIGMWEGASGTVSDNTVSDDDYILSPQQALGISVLESSTVTVSDNTLDDDNVAIAVDSFGVDATAAKVSGVVVTDNSIDYNSTYRTFTTGTVEVNNRVGTQGIAVASYHGTTPSSVSAVIEGNAVSGPMFDDSTVTPDVTDTGLQVGDMDAYPGSEFATVGGTLSVTAAGNTFSGWTADATVLGTLTGAATADLQLNNFETASAFGVDNLSGTPTSVGITGTTPMKVLVPTNAVIADATSSWWGCPTGPSTSSPCTAASSNVDDAPVLASAVTSGVSSSGAATATTADVTVTATGNGVVNLGQYGGNPEAGALESTTGVYFDVNLSPGNTFTGATVRACNLNGGDSLSWWDGAAWEPVTPQSYAAGPPSCVTAPLTSTSSPSLAELTGTVFGVSSPAPSTPSTPSAPSTPAPGTTRVAGVTADATAAAELTRAFPYSKDSCPPSRDAVLATTKTYQDALSSQPLAASLTTGTLLTPTESLSTVTATTLKEEGIKTVYVVGGPLAVTTTVLKAIESLTAYGCGGTTPIGKITVTRLYGQTQYGTAEAVAEHLGTAPQEAFPGAYGTTNATGGTGRYNDTSGKGTAAPSGSVPTAILASGAEFQDAQAASVVSYRTKLPLLLTEATTLSTTAVTAVEKLGIEQVVLVGGPLAVTNTVEAALVAKTGVSVLRVAGKDYTDTAVQLARFELATSTAGLGWTPGHRVMVARGNGFTDGLAGAVLENPHNTTTGASGTARPLLLTESPTTVGTYLITFLKVTGHTGIDKTASKTITALTILGGTLAVSATEVTQMETALSH